MTAAHPSRIRRWALHPLSPTLALLILVLTGAAAALRGATAASAVLACVAGCAAGFANSGST
jgi:hypothetical protein